MSAKTEKKSKRRKIKGSGGKRGIRIGLSIMGGGLFAVLLLLYLAGALYYRSHFLGNTVINGIDTANMTVSEAEKAINSEVASYRLTLEERNNLSDTILGSNFDLHTEFNDYVNKLLTGQNSLAWPLYLFQEQNYDVETMLAYDEDLLKICFERLNCFDEANIVEPANASISAYGKNGYEIVAQEQGTKVIKDKLYEAVVEAINLLEPTLSLEEVDCYEKPEITSEYPALVQALDKMNKIAGAKITYQFGDAIEIVDGERISAWISLDDNYNVSFDENGVKEFVDYIGKTYNSFGRVRTFKTTYGDVIKVKGGDYGWWLNRPEEVKELSQLVQDGETLTKEPVYFQTAQQYGEDDIGNTYVEVNLTAQHLFFYYEGELVVESDFVSGNVSKDWGTPTGTYPVQYKENNATLVGEDYSTPVKYWMPFNKNIGFHDASWRSKFGKDIYLTSGSHGCINMPPENAKKMFQYIKRGVAVVVYELAGTENYDTDKDKKTDSSKTNTTTEKTTTENSTTQNNSTQNGTATDSAQ